MPANGCAGNMTSVLAGLTDPGVHTALSALEKPQQLQSFNQDTSTENYSFPGQSQDTNLQQANNTHECFLKNPNKIQQISHERGGTSLKNLFKQP